MAETVVRTPVRPADTDVCTSCGLCCDGTLFNFAKVLPEEREAARALGLRMTDRDGGLVFAQPCSLLLNRCCTIYLQRPSVCRSYTCVVLSKVRRGTITSARADEIVQTAIALRERLHDAQSADKEANDGPSAAIRFATFTLNHYLERQFIRKPVGDDMAAAVDGAAGTTVSDR